MSLFYLSNPTASISRVIENIVITGSNTKHTSIKVGCFALSRVVSLTIFPIVIGSELVFKRMSKLIFACGDLKKIYEEVDKVIKFTLGFLFSPLGAFFPEGVSGFYLRNRPLSNVICPFGVEKQYGMVMDYRIVYPKTVEKLQEVVRQAKKDNKQISIIGKGMSQGTQTVPKNSNQIVVNTRCLNQMTLSEDKKRVTAQSGATWEHIQYFLNQHGKSTIVKQASDPFSVGGSIGINCHGWAHAYGAISSTVESLKVITADGELKTITPEDELFGCMFGTLGYFGIVISATFKVVDNEHLIKKAEEIELSDFAAYYKTKVKGREDIPLFGGRLTLDNLDGSPLRKVCAVSYIKDPSQPITNNGVDNFILEPKFGRRMERIALKLVAHLCNFSTTRLLSWFWEKERKDILSQRHLTRNEALHPPINAFNMLHHSNLHTQWLQEYFIKEKNLQQFLLFLGSELKANSVRLINATIRPTPKDNVSILPYAEQDRYAIVICFSQIKSDKEIKHTKQWIERVNKYLVASGDVFYQAYMPYATQEQFEKCYGVGNVNKMRAMKAKFDPENRFGNRHTRKYYDRKQGG